MTTRELRDQTLYVVTRIDMLADRITQLMVDSQEATSTPSMTLARSQMEEAANTFRAASRMLSSAVASIAISATAEARRPKE